MSSALRKSEPVTIAEFDAFLDVQIGTTDYELIDGVVFAMANPTATHEQIVANFAAPLKLAMDMRRCQTFIGGMRVQRSSDVTELFKTRPDILARCGARASGTFITDPEILVEVLSPSTMDADRGRKLEFYKSLPCVQHIILVYQDQMRVEHYKREDDAFVLDVLTRATDSLTLPSHEFQIDLSRINFDTGL